MKITTGFTVLFALFCLGFIADIFIGEWRRRDVLFPVIIGIPTIALAIAQVWLDTRRAQKPGEANSGTGAEARISVWIRDLYGTNFNYVLAFFWAIGLVVAIYLFGYYITIPLFLIFYFKLHERGWRSSAILTVAISAVLYLSFVIGFRFYFYQGLLIKFILKLLYT